MSRFNISTNHPIIPNSQEYTMEKKYVSIHSEDRDITRFPNSADFEIELPEDYYNVQSIQLLNWAFPANYDTFSILRSNISMSFKITDPYNPGKYESNNPLLNVIFQALYNHINDLYFFTIASGFYNPIQMATELTNKFNDAVTNVILQYFYDN
jgi:hypothetical protein